MFANLTACPDDIPVGTKVLILSNNHITMTSPVSRRMNRIRKSLKHLKKIDLSYNKFKRIPTGIISGLFRLKSLLLKGNKILSIKKSVLFRLKYLEILDLSYNMLVEYDERYVPRYHLNLAGNMITKFPHVRRRIKYLNLNKNNISRVEVHSFPEIMELHLAENSIKSLPPLYEISLNQSLVLNLTGNPLVCNLDLAWLVIKYTGNKTCLGNCYRPLAYEGQCINGLDPGKLTRDYKG